MEDMREKTHGRHYELYRKKRLEQMGFSDVDADNKPVSFQQTFETKRSNHLQELQQKEDEMRQMFVLRVKEKEAELKEAEKDVSIMINTYIFIFLFDYRFSYTLSSTNLRKTIQRKRKKSKIIARNWKRRL